MGHSCSGKKRKGFQRFTSSLRRLHHAIVAELIKAVVLSMNVELAHEITSWMEGCAARAEGPKSTPLSNLIISYYETGLDRAVALRQMHLLNLQLEGKRAKDLEEFVMVSSLLIDSPRRLCLNGCGIKSKRRITDKVRESSQGSQKRSFEWISTQRRPR